MNKFKYQSVGAVVVNYNSGNDIIKCLSALYVQSFKLDKIVVVDNGSTDDSIKLAKEKFPGVEFVELGKNFGTAFARNKSLEYISSEYIVFVDDDVYLEPTCIFTLLTGYSESGADIIFPRVVFYSNNNVQCDGASIHFTGNLTLINNHKKISGLSEDYKEVGAGIGSCMLMKRDFVIDKRGFDDEYFMYYEDVEFCLRCSKSGNRLVCYPKAVVFHNRGAGTPGLSYRSQGSYPPLRAYMIMRGRLRTILLHYDLSTLILLSPALFLYELSAFLYCLRRMWIREWIGSWLSVIRDINEILDKRKQYNKQKILKDIDVLKGGKIPFNRGLIQSSFENVYMWILNYLLNTYWQIYKNFSYYTNNVISK